MPRRHEVEAVGVAAVVQAVLAHLAIAVNAGAQAAYNADADAAGATTVALPAAAAFPKEGVRNFWLGREDDGGGRVYCHSTATANPVVARRRGHNG